MYPILIVEDEVRAAQSIEKGLKEHGYPTELAHDGETALKYLNENTYALIILDVMLPKQDGWTVLTALRSKGLRTPVMMLTAQNDVSNRVKGLQLGADDYLGKPFSFTELLARIEAILRRTQSVIPADILSIADLTLQLSTQTVFRAGQPIDLSPKEFQLLCVLIEGAGRCIPRNVLIKRVWAIDFDCETNVLEVAIGRLRQKIDTPFSIGLIHTVRGIGYILEAREKH